MFEGVVAAVLNRFLGKYVQDLDTENLNVGIFGGDVQLHNLRIRPEALVSIIELSLNLEMKIGGRSDLIWGSFMLCSTSWTSRSR